MGDVNEPGLGKDDKDDEDNWTEEMYNGIRSASNAFPRLILSLQTSILELNRLQAINGGKGVDNVIKQLQTAYKEAKEGSASLVKAKDALPEFGKSIDRYNNMIDEIERSRKSEVAALVELARGWPTDEFLAEQRLTTLVEQHPELSDDITTLTDAAVLRSPRQHARTMQQIQRAEMQTFSDNDRKQILANALAHQRQRAQLFSIAIQSASTPPPPPPPLPPITIPAFVSSPIATSTAGGLTRFRRPPVGYRYPFYFRKLRQ
jgi:hypothetical protein